MIITERTRDAMENANLSDRDTGVMQLNLTAQEEKNKSTPRKKMGKNFEKIKMKEKKHHPKRWFPPTDQRTRLVPSIH